MTDDREYLARLEGYAAGVAATEAKYAGLLAACHHVMSCIARYDGATTKFEATRAIDLIGPPVSAAIAKAEGGGK